MVVPWRLIWGNLFASKLVALRTVLTLASMVVAIFLVCILRALVVSLDAGVQAAASNRLIVQSAVSLFVDLPLAYQGKIAASVPGIEKCTKFTWFGGFYREQANFFGQFAVDPETFLDVYPEIELVEGKREDWGRVKTGCLIGRGLVQRFGWKVGDRIPLIATIFARDDGQPWEFQVVGIYEARTPNVDNATLFFPFEYLRQTAESETAMGRIGSGTYVLSLADGTRPETVMAAVDGLFAGGPQRVQTTTEAEFQRQFVSMLGNIPTFIGSIGGGVLFAIMLAVLNTMLMAGRERTRDIGVMKALGFTDATAFTLLLAESLLLCGLGGALGVGLAVLIEPGLQQVMGSMFPGFRITGGIIGMGLGLTLAIGLVAGIAPAWRASRLKCVDAIQAEG